MTWQAYMFAVFVFWLVGLNFWASRIIRRQASIMLEAAKLLALYQQRDNAGQS